MNAIYIARRQGLLRKLQGCLLINVSRPGQVSKKYLISSQTYLYLDKSSLDCKMQKNVRQGKKDAENYPEALSRPINVVHL